jgi:hypothetical protein
LTGYVLEVWAQLWLLAEFEHLATRLCAHCGDPLVRNLNGRISWGVVGARNDKRVCRCRRWLREQARERRERKQRGVLLVPG